MKPTDAEVTAKIAEFLGLPPVFGSAVLTLVPGRAPDLRVTNTVKAPVGQLGSTKRTDNFTIVPTGSYTETMPGGGMRCHFGDSRAWPGATLEEAPTLSKGGSGPEPKSAADCAQRLTVNVGDTFETSDEFETSAGQAAALGAGIKRALARNT